MLIARRRLLVLLGPASIYLVGIRPTQAQSASDVSIQGKPNGDGTYYFSTGQLRPTADAVPYRYNLVPTGSSSTLSTVEWTGGGTNGNGDYSSISGSTCSGTFNPGTGVGSFNCPSYGGGGGSQGCPPVCVN
jgi:hypothetical protein